MLNLLKLVKNTSIGNLGKSKRENDDLGREYVSRETSFSLDEVRAYPIFTSPPQSQKVFLLSLYH